MEAGKGKEVTEKAIDDLGRHCLRHSGLYDGPFIHRDRGFSSEVGAAPSNLDDRFRLVAWLNFGQRKAHLGGKDDGLAEGWGGDWRATCEVQKGIGHLE